jgi:hypothetical protein
MATSFSFAQNKSSGVYHLLLLLQHEEAMWSVCLTSMSERASPVYRAA